MVRQCLARDQSGLADRSSYKVCLLQGASPRETSASCGLTRYSGRAFGPEYRDNLFAALFNMQKVTRHVLEPEGATFKTRDIGHPLGVLVVGHGQVDHVAGELLGHVGADPDLPVRHDVAPPVAFLTGVPGTRTPNAACATRSIYFTKARGITQGYDHRWRAEFGP